VGLALLLVAVVWKIVSYKIKLAAALKAERQRALIDSDAIAASSWEGDKAAHPRSGEQRRAASPPFPNLNPPDR
jgi:hypothetical protein